VLDIIMSSTGNNSTSNNSTYDGIIAGNNSTSNNSMGWNYFKKNYYTVMDCLRATFFSQSQVCCWNRCFWDFQIEVCVRKPVSVKEVKGIRTLIVLLGSASK